MGERKINAGRENQIFELLVLSMLAKRDCYTYEMTQLNEKISNGKMKINGNTMYTMMYKYKEIGFVTEYIRQAGARRTRIYYHLEDAGREQLTKLQLWWANTEKSVNDILSYQLAGNESE